MACRMWCGAVVGVAFALAGGGSAAAETRIYTVAGRASSSFTIPSPAPRPGSPATSQKALPQAVVGLPEGGFAFSDFMTTRVLRVDPRGRLSVLAGNGEREVDENGEWAVDGDGGPATDASIRLVTGLKLYGGGLLLLSGDPLYDGLRHVGADGIIQSIRVLIEGVSLSDSPFGVQLHDVAVAPDGALLLATPTRVWRLARDGAVTPFAGDGRDVSDGDGGPATTAGVRWPVAVEAMTDGSVYIAQGDGRLRRVTPEGVISTVPGSFGFSDLAAGPGGLLIGAERSRVFTVDPNGNKAVLAGGGRRLGFDGDGGDPNRTELRPWDVSVAADGGVLIVDANANTVRYIAPAHPALLAAAITRPTLTSPRHVRVSLATTLPATVSVRVGRRPRVVQTVAGGDATIALAGPRVASGATLVRVVARAGDGQVATDRQVIFPGGRLTVRSARQIARHGSSPWLEPFDFGAPLDVGGCRRFARNRIDCRLRPSLSCTEFVSVRLRHGVPVLRFYRSRDCRYRAHPPGRDRTVEPF